MGRGGYNQNISTYQLFSCDLMWFLRRANESTALPAAHLPPALIAFLFLRFPVTPTPHRPGLSDLKPSLTLRPGSSPKSLRCAGVGFLAQAAWPWELPAGCKGSCRGANGKQVSLPFKLPKVPDYCLLHPGFLD